MTINTQRTKQRRYPTQVVAAPSIPDYDQASIKMLREKLQISQATLAVLLNVSLSTVRHWELGIKQPGGPSAKLLDILERKGIGVLS